ncbi:hypothetical protein K3495_g14957 [Podosphaera aphanis]|nr:hypothetical protein K3495_g14957 [Podosphaera aphanis]
MRAPKEPTSEELLADTTGTPLMRLPQPTPQMSMNMAHGQPGRPQHHSFQTFGGHPGYHGSQPGQPQWQQQQQGSQQWQQQSGSHQQQQQYWR